MKFYLLLLSWLSILLFALPAEAARLLFWRFNPSQNQLLFTTDAGVQPNAQLISNPTRLVIDLPGINFSRPTVNQSFRGTIRKLRVGQFDNRTTRIVIELAPGYTIDPDKIEFRGVSPTNWSVSLPQPERLSAQSRQPRQPRQLRQTAPKLPPLPPPGNTGNPSTDELVATIDAIQLVNRRLVVRGDRALGVSSRWNDRAGLYEITIPYARLADRLRGPELESDSPISELRVRQQDKETVILLLQPSESFRIGNIDRNGSQLNIDLDTNTSLVVPANTSLAVPADTSLAVPAEPLTRLY